MDRVLPANPEEYKRIISEITNGSGVFPGDKYAAPINRYTKPRWSEIIFPYKIFRYDRGLKSYDVECFAPARDCQGLKNRIVFDLDLISQISIYNTYGYRGSYDRTSVYEKRFFNADFVLQIRYRGMPAGISIVSKHTTTILIDEIEMSTAAHKHLVGENGLYIEIPFYIVHGVMVANSKQRLTSNLLGDYFGGEYLFNKNKYIPYYDSKTHIIEAFRGGLYILGHSDKVIPFHLSRVALTPVRTGVVRDAVLRKSFNIINSNDTKNNVEFDLKKGTDKSCAPPCITYRRDLDGNVEIPDHEKLLSSYPEFRKIVKNRAGDRSIYTLGIFTIRTLKKTRKKIKKFNRRNISNAILTGIYRRLLGVKGIFK